MNGPSVAQNRLPLFPQQRTSRDLGWTSAFDPKEKSAVSEEAEHWPLKSAREVSQDRSRSWPPYPVRHVPIGRGCRAEAAVRKILRLIDDLRPRPVLAYAEEIDGQLKSTEGVCLDDGKYGQMAFREPPTDENQSIRKAEA